MNPLKIRFDISLNPYVSGKKDRFFEATEKMPYMWVEFLVFFAGSLVEKHPHPTPHFRHGDFDQE
jgi:hypothetical protein